MQNKPKTSKSLKWAVRTLLCLLLTLVLAAQTALPASFAFATEADDTTTLSTTCRGTDGKSYRVTASYSPDAGIPADAALSVAVISKSDSDYASFVSQAEQELSCTIDRTKDIQLFDISIVNETNDSIEYQPAEGASVSMTVRLAAAPETELGVVHFGEETERIDSEVNGRNVSFEATGFSVYAFVAIVSRDSIVHDVSGFGETPVYLSATTSGGNTYYISSAIAHYPGSGNNTGDVISRTPKNSTEGAAAYAFEKIAGTDNQFYMYLTVANTKKYVKLTNNTKAEFVLSSSEATPLTIIPGGDEHPNTFLLSFVQSGTTWYLNLRKDENGYGFNGSDYGPPPKDSVGSYLTAYYFLPDDEDILDLDGKTYGIVSNPIKNVSVALTAEAQNATTLAGEAMPVRANPLDNSQDVTIKVGGDIAMYTFHAHGNNTYYITTQVGGATRYLNIHNGAATLVSTPDEYSVFHINSGSGEYVGRIKITCAVTNGQSLSNPKGAASSGFIGKNSNTTAEYFYLAEQVDLGDDDFVPYTAIKVSVSDRDRVSNGSQVIVYTRIWNDDTKRYDYYAINHDGSLKQVYDEDDTIRWAGAQINTLLWEFTEYYYWPYFLHMPNYYYELQNTYSGKYLAPQVHSGQILSNRKIGINLNGRRYKDYYTTILAWDDFRYDYAGLKTKEDNSKIVSVPMSKAQDFYFAIMDDPVPTEFSTVKTLDNNDYGISMRMVNFLGQKLGDNGQPSATGAREQTQTEVIGYDTITFTGGSYPVLGLVSTKLQDDGYPVATHTQKSLEELFGDAETVNKLFLQSTYEEGGYFEYDCTKTFATLKSNGDFRVYDQLGTVETSTNSQGHGFFMPYNDIDPNVISAYTNVTNVLNQPLATNDPRLGEQLYSIPKSEAQYHFGMVMEASFIQSKSGLDAWGHDIVFEFAGDDDMWLYVDGELVLDLGGVHSALVGKINYRTGQVTIPNPEVDGGLQTTTLRALFEANYRGRRPNDSDEQVNAFLGRYFNEGETVFKDYSSHTMKMFYMERGAGASNLHMRFNLTTSIDGQLLLSKKVSGTDKSDYTSARFPYQIEYYDNDWAQWRTVHRTTQHDENNEVYYEYNGISFIHYQGTQVPVEYEENYNGTPDVFFLKPGEVAEIQFPDDKTHYRIRECHVNTEIYDHVYVNDAEIPMATETDGFAEYVTEEDVIDQQKVVNFDNHVSPSALHTLTIEKNLFDEKGNRLQYNADDPNNDDTGFRFRVYIGPGTDTDDGLGYYRFGSYFVKDENDYYCCYDYNTQKFEPLPGNKTVFSQLTEDDLEICTFTTSPSGAIDKIPNDHKVEIRNLLVDTQFRILERESDIPKGYSFKDYRRADGSYLVGEGNEMNSGIVRDNNSPHIIVENYRGWGITVQKVWTDDSFMLSHDNIYFAAYCKGVLIPGTVRMMKTEISDPTIEEAETSLYYYFDQLGADCGFSDYTIREVMINCDFTVDDNGYVTHTDETDITGDELTVCGGSVHLINGGVPTQTGEHGSFAYSAEYVMGQPGGCANNVRTDTVTNSRPGIRIVKVDGSGNALEGAMFTLSYGEGDNANSIRYTSDSTGLITFAYPEEGVTYTMTETEAPDGYSVLTESFTFTKTGSELSVTGTDNGVVTVSEADADGTITIRIKNMTTAFTAVKVDAESGNPIPDVHFALYRQVLGTNGLRKDYYPLSGYSDLVTDAEGLIPGIDLTLPTGTYYLCETQTTKEYLPLESDIVFTIGANGNVTVEAPNAAMLKSVINGDGALAYTLKIPNRRSFKSVTLDPQTLVADFGLDINYNVKSNNYRATEAVYSYIGICSCDSYDKYGTQTAPELLASVNEPFKGKFGTVELDAQGNAHYTIDTMSFTGEDEFCLVAEVTKISGKNSTVYAYEMLTYLPATTVYYEDDFPTGEKIYRDGVEKTPTGHDFGKWSETPEEKTGQATEQAADLAANEGANIFGFDPHYTEFATYSNNSAHKVSVSSVNSDDNTPPTNENWPYMQFDFAGTGFDIISVTGGDTGMFVVKVYPYETDANGQVTVSETPIASKVVNTYYGYSYGRLYMNSDCAVTLDESGNTPLYEATQAMLDDANWSHSLLTASGKFLTSTPTYYNTQKQPTETPFYYDDSGHITDTIYYINLNNSSDVRSSIPEGEEEDYEPNYAYALAEGWLLDTSTDQALYQIPVVRIEGLSYGRYFAKVEARFTSFYGHYLTIDGYNYYDLYVDAIRIYDPAGVDKNGVISSEIIREAYSYSHEAFEKFTTLKNVIIGVETMGGYEEDEKACEGAVIVDGGVVLNSERINDYGTFGPHNELYLSKGMSVAFDLSASVVPADVQVQLKKISEAIPTLRITYVNKNNEIFSKDITIRSATDLSYSILNSLGKANFIWEKPNNNTNYASGLVIISNVGEDESLISITNLKWTFKNSGGKYNYFYGTYNVSISQQNVVNLNRALAFSNRNITVQQVEETPAAYEDGVITMSVITGSDVDTLVVRDADGELIDESLLDMTFDAVDDNQRQWTVTVTEDEDDDYTFLIYAESGGIVSGDPITIRVTVDNDLPDEGPETNSNTGDNIEEPQLSGFEKLLEQLRSFWRRLTDVVKTILSLFGVQFT